MKSFFGALLVCAVVASVLGGGDPCQYFILQYVTNNKTFIDVTNNFTVLDAFCDLPSNAGSFCLKTAPTTNTDATKAHTNKTPKNDERFPD